MSGHGLERKRTPMGVQISERDAAVRPQAPQH